MAENPTEDLGHFFDYIWGEQQGYVYLPTKSKDGTWERVMFEWPKARSGIIRHVIVKTAETKDVYFAPAIFSAARPIKENFKSSSVLWVEFDGNAPTDWSPETQEVVTPAPSLRIQSSTDGHEHIYWKLNESTTDVKFIEDTNRALAYQLKADTSGWDINQVLRPPETTNYKHNLPVTISEESTRIWKPIDFSHFKPVKQLVSEALDVTDIPKAAEVLLKYSWDESHAELFQRETIEEGQRSSALMRLGFFGAESGMADAEIYSILLDADDRWGKFKHRSDRKLRLLDIINKARQKHPVGITSPEGLLRSLSGEGIVEAPQYVYGFESLLNSEFTIEWAIDGLMPIGGQGLISSAPGLGKTQFSIQLGLHCALGKNYLGWKINKRLKIVLFSLEMNHVEMKYFAETMGGGYSPSEIEMLERNFHFVTLGEPLPVDSLDGRKFLESILDEYKPDGVIFDSMGKLTNEELKERKVKQLDAYFASIRAKYGCFLWFIHHNRKANGDNKKPKELSDIYGSQYVTANATSVLGLWKDNPEDNAIEVIYLKIRFAPLPKPFKIIRDSTLNFNIEGQPGQNLVNNDSATSSKPKQPGSDESTGTLFKFE